MIFELSYTYKRRRWDFPRERFVTYEPKDERWCRPLGIGREVEETVTVTIPRAYFSDATEDGVTIKALPSPSSLLTVEAK